MCAGIEFDCRVSLYRIYTHPVTFLLHPQGTQNSHKGSSGRQLQHHRRHHHAVRAPPRRASPSHDARGALLQARCVCGHILGWGGEGEGCMNMARGARYWWRRFPLPLPPPRAYAHACKRHATHAHIISRQQ